MFFPWKIEHYEDGGTVAYSSLTYKICVWNGLSGKRDILEIYYFPENFKNLTELNIGRTAWIRDRFAAVILKIMCYCHTAALWNGWIDRPAPELIDGAIATIMENHSGTLNCVFPEENALLVFDWDCLNLSVYHPSERMRRLLKRIADSEGLFWRRSES